MGVVSTQFANAWFTWAFSHAQDLLLAQYCHVSLVGRRASVFHGDRPVGLEICQLFRAVAIAVRDRSDSRIMVFAGIHDERCKLPVWYWLRGMIAKIVEGWMELEDERKA